ncbi:MAG: hypothetical protein WC108_05320 [Bacteroidales bacterium]|jgi:hypothetical protein
MSELFKKYLNKDPIKKEEGIEKKVPTYTSIPVSFGNAKGSSENRDIPKKDTTRSLKYTEDGRPIFRVSQSLIKQFTTKNGMGIPYCPFKIYTCNIIKSHNTITTLPMMKGNFFESLAIGGTAYGEAVLDLPRAVRPKGQKTIDQIRIEEQAIEFKRLCQQYGIEITEDNTQVKYKVDYPTEWDDKFKIYLTGVIDIEHKIYYQGEFIEAVIDLKLTADLKNTFGPFAWGNASQNDHLQFDMYNLMSGKRCVYWVFDYSKNKNQEMFMHDPDEEDIIMMHARIKHTIIELTFCYDSEWPVIADYDSCSNCPHNPKNTGNCRSADNIKTI